jgi:hypothetical protein
MLTRNGRVRPPLLRLSKDQERLGTRLRLDYLAEPSSRLIAACEDGSTRDTCFAAPTRHPASDWPPACK